MSVFIFSYIVIVMLITNLYYTKVLNHVESTETAPELYMEHFPESIGSFLVWIFLNIVKLDYAINICMILIGSAMNSLTLTTSIF